MELALAYFLAKPVKTAYTTPMSTIVKRPTQREAEDAVRTLIRWAGDDPAREGLMDTPARVIRSYSELFSGYSISPESLLERTFEETESYDEMIILKDVLFESHCEHHMLPIIGKAHVAYIPNKRVIGISKLARIVDAFAKRLQIQEKLTVQIAQTIYNVLQPQGVGVVIEATHHCMSTRGVHKAGVTMQTSHLLGLFRSNRRTRNEFLNLITGKAS